MTTRTGIWIDHREAFLVHLPKSGNPEPVTHILSNAESQARRAGDHASGRFEPQNVQADDTQNRKFTAELSAYYDAVATHLQQTQTLLILGPGEARKELMKHIQSGYRMPTDVTVEPADHMTEHQIVARVKEFFQP